VTVRAAGAVVRRGDGAVLVIHRPQYDDWTLPKGKVEPGETDEECAVREVEEETGLRIRLGDELPSVQWTDRHGQPKVCRYWTAASFEGDPVAQNEVDAVEWLAVEVARERLTYPRDRDVLQAVVG
jgi:8-oxo-dGTP pyrophosphatase MutT (NUDIX family)